MFSSRCEHWYVRHLVYFSCRSCSRVDRSSRGGRRRRTRDTGGARASKGGGRSRRHLQASHTKRCYRYRALPHTMTKRHHATSVHHVHHRTTVCNTFGRNVRRERSPFLPNPQPPYHSASSAPWTSLSCRRSLLKLKLESFTWTQRVEGHEDLEVDRRRVKASGPEHPIDIRGGIFRDLYRLHGRVEQKLATPLDGEGPRET